MEKLPTPEKINLLLWDTDQQRNRCLEVLLRLNNFCVFSAHTLEQCAELAFMASPDIFLLHLDFLENHHLHEIQSFLNTVNVPIILMGSESSSSDVKKLTHPQLSKVQLPATITEIITEIITAIKNTKPSNHSRAKPNTKKSASSISTENLRDDAWELGNRWPTVSELDNMNPRKMREKIGEKKTPIQSSSSWAEKIIRRFLNSRPATTPSGRTKSLNAQKPTP